MPTWNFNKGCPGQFFFLYLFKVIFFTDPKNPDPFRSNRICRVPITSGSNRIQTVQSLSNQTYKRILRGIGVPWDSSPLFTTISRLQICPLYIFGNKAADGTYGYTVNIGFQGFALIQGQINLQPCIWENIFGSLFPFASWPCKSKWLVVCKFSPPRPRSSREDSETIFLMTMRNPA